MLSINSNSSSLSLMRHMRANMQEITKSSARLSTGSQINTAADAPSGVVISSLMRRQIVGLEQTVQNLERTASLVNTADGGLADLADQLFALRDVIVDAANTGVHDAHSVAAKQTELHEILDSIDEISSSTKFGGISVLDGTVGAQATISDVVEGSFTTQINKISGVSASTSLGQASTTQTMTKAVNNSGLSSTTSLSATHNRTTSNMWRSLTLPTTSSPGTVTFDLGATYDLDRMAVWNYNGRTTTSTGVKDVTVSTSTDGVNYTALAGGPTQFARATGVTALAPQSFTFSATSARYVKFNITSSWGGTRVGLSEVGFGYTELVPVTTVTPERIESVSLDTSQVAAGSSLDVAVETAAEKAVIVTGTGSPGTTTGEAVGGSEQTSALAASETLTLNGVDITLTAGMTRDQVIARINEFTTQTGVTADNPSGDVTRLVSSNYGSAATISVISNRSSSTTSSGFGTTETFVSGADIVGSIGGTAATGEGRVLTGATGTSAAGVSVTIDPSTDGLSTYTGAVGVVTIDVESATFTTGGDAGESTLINIGSVSTSNLGTSATGSSGGANIFSSLRDINVSSSTNAQEALLVVDTAIAEIAAKRGSLGATLSGTIASARNLTSTFLDLAKETNGGLEDTDYGREIERLLAGNNQAQIHRTVAPATGFEQRGAARLLSAARLTSAESGYAPFLQPITPVSVANQ